VTFELLATANTARLFTESGPGLGRVSKT